MTQLATSRMTPPKLKKNLISRMTLQHKIQAGFKRKVTVLEAGAGHGKTFAIRQALTSLPVEQWRWLSLAADSNHLTLFWSYILETLIDFLGEKKAEALTYFQQSIQENNLSEFGLFLLDCLPQQDIYLVLDDFHFIQDATVVASIDLFFAELPEYFHVILVTRYKPAVYLGKLMMENELHYIQKKDFLLSAEEASDFIVSLKGNELPAEAQMEISERARGWLGGLQLLLLSNDYMQENKGESSQKSVVFDYLTKEILANLPEKEACFLQRTAYYPFVFPKLSQVLFPEITYTEMLRNLQKCNLMITWLDGTEERFTYHPLLQESLIAAFLEQPASEIANQKNKAASAFIKNGYLDEGLALLFDLANYQQIMQLLVDHPQNLRATFYIDQLPDEIAVTNPDFAFLKLFYYYTILNYEKLDSLIVAIEANYPVIEEIGVLEGMRLLTGINHAQIEVSLVSDETIYSLPLHDVSKAFIFLKNAMILYYQNAFRQAITAVEKSLVLNQRYQNPFINYFNQTFLAQIYEEIGDFDQGLSLLEKTQQKIETLNTNDQINLNYHLNFNLTIAGIYLKKMQLDSAKQALDRVANHKHKHMQASFLYNYAEYLYLEDQPSEALKTVKELDMTHYYQNIRMKSGLFRYMLKNGQLSKQLQRIISNDYKQQNKLSISNQLFYGMLLLEQGELVAALNVVDQVLTTSRKEGIYLRIIGADLLKIDILLQTGEANGRLLLDIYHEALYYGKENQILNEFFLYRHMLKKLYGQTAHQLYARLSSDEQTFQRKIEQLIQPKASGLLSKREIEVLEELAKGLTNKEISENLFVSTATIKTHILNIYRKLEVNSRVAAVEHARKLGIIA